MNGNLGRLFSPPIAIRVVGIGAAALGLEGLVWGDFASVWQPEPTLASAAGFARYAVALASFVAGLSLEWRRTSRSGALVLTALYMIAVVTLDVPRVVRRPSEFLSWYGVAEPLALAAGALLAHAAGARAGLARIGRCVFGVCLACFGTAHVVYGAYTASLVPTWLPASGKFWTYATALADLAAAVAMLTGRCREAAGALLTLMFVIFGLLVHLPALYAHPAVHANWVEAAITLGLIGTAWTSAVADPSHERRPRP